MTLKSNASLETIVHVLNELRDDVRTLQESVSEAIGAGAEQRRLLEIRIVELEGTIRAAESRMVTYRQMLTWLGAAVAAMPAILGAYHLLTNWGG